MLPSGPASHAVRPVPMLSAVLQDLLTVTVGFIDWVQVAKAVLVDCKVSCPLELSAAIA